MRLVVVKRDITWVYDWYLTFGTWLDLSLRHTCLLAVTCKSKFILLVLKGIHFLKDGLIFNHRGHTQEQIFSLIFRMSLVLWDTWSADANTPWEYFVGANFEENSFNVFSQSQISYSLCLRSTYATDATYEKPDFLPFSMGQSMAEKCKTSGSIWVF